MKAKELDDVENDVFTDSQDESNNKTSSTKRLERRRRIEELNEERLLRQELSEFE
jgi:hypothetical protein